MTSRASSSMPWMKVDLRRRSTGRPSAYSPGASTTPPSCRRWPFSSTHRHVQPAVVGPESGRPDDRCGSSPPRRSSCSGDDGGHARRLEALGRADVGVASGRRAPTRRTCRAAAPSSDRRARTGCAGRPRTARGRRGSADSRPTSSTPIAVSALRSSVARSRRADELRRRQPARARQVVDLVVALVPDARRVHPPQHVAAAIRARQPHVLADRQRHGPAGAVDLGGELHAGRRRADDEDAAFGQRDPGCGSRTA